MECSVTRECKRYYGLDGTIYYHLKEVLFKMELNDANGYYSRNIEKKDKYKILVGGKYVAGITHEKVLDLMLEHKPGFRRWIARELVKLEM